MPDHAWSKFTPFENQYWGIKKDHWDTLVFFKKVSLLPLFGFLIDSFVVVVVVVVVGQVLRAL